MISKKQVLKELKKLHKETDGENISANTLVKIALFAAYAQRVGLSFEDIKI